MSKNIEQLADVSKLVTLTHLYLELSLPVSAAVQAAEADLRYWTSFNYLAGQGTTIRPETEVGSMAQGKALTGAEARDDSATGQLVLEGRTGEPASKDGIRIWAGRIADSFYIDLSLLTIVNGAIKNGTAVDLSA